jgi:hypothetical protein
LSFKNIIVQISHALQIKKCVVCDGLLLGQYAFDNWGQTAHLNCFNGNCFSCGRLLNKNHKKLQDGRLICEGCNTSIVANSEDINWVDQRVQAVLKSIGITSIPRTPIELVSKQALIQMHNSNSIGDTYGLAQYVAIGSTKQFKIFILDNLPKTFFAGVLAHEYMHVWQYQNDINPPREICEGFCNLGSMAMYQKINTQFSSFLLEQMEQNPDSIYGDGYRKVHRFWQKNQWLETIKKMNNYK